VSAVERATLIYTTFPSPAEAKRIGAELVRNKLAACVNILAPMTAIYEWEGTLEEAEETPMLIKTRAGLKARVIAEVERLHSYDTPAVLVLDVTEGSDRFLRWIAAQTEAGAPVDAD